MNRKITAEAIAGLIVIVVTLLAFFVVTGERDTIHWLCLFFIILAELILTCGIMGIRYFAHPRAERALGAWAYTVLILYSALSVSMAILFLNRYPDSVRWFITIQVSLMVLAAISLILLFVNFIPESETAQLEKQHGKDP